MVIGKIRRYVRTNRRNVVAGTVVVLFGAIGLALLNLGNAATGSVAAEAETGRLAGNATSVSGVGASGGASVRFGGTTSGAFTLPLKISSNGRYLVGSNGAPFFYLGDTAWSMLVSLSHEDMTSYMTTRKNQGFTVIQSAIFFNQNGQPQGSPYDGSADNINEDFFQNQVDFAVNKAKELGLVLALHPAWADGQVGGALNDGNAQGYGEYLGNRYKNANNIIWVMGGDYPGDDTSTWRNLAKGIAIGQTGSEDYSQSIMTYHPRGDQTSSTWFRNDTWLDIVAVQSGHCPSEPLPWDMVEEDYSRTPVKPVFDFEPMYENHPYCWEKPPDGFAGPLEARKMAYWDVFAGGFGHAYGHHSVWPFVTDGHPFNGWGGGADGTWQEGIQAEGGKQMVHLKQLMLSRPFTSRVPDQSIIASDAGGGMDRKQATRDSSGSYLMVYTPDGGFSANLNKLSGTAVEAYWYDPRTGQATDANVSKGASVQLTPPGDGDWVFVADDASKGFGRPGQ